jgi:hypothetical protein
MILIFEQGIEASILNLTIIAKKKRKQTYVYNKKTLE